MPHYGSKIDTTYSDNFMYILIDNNYDTLIKIIEGCIGKYLISQYSENGFDILKSIQFLKKIPNNINNINDVYKYYNLTQNQINYIKKEFWLR